MYVVATQFADRGIDHKVFVEASRAKAFVAERTTAVASGAFIDDDLPERVIAFRVTASNEREAVEIVKQKGCPATVLVDSADQASIEEPYEPF